MTADGKLRWLTSGGVLVAALQGVLMILSGLAISTEGLLHRLVYTGIHLASFVWVLAAIGGMAQARRMRTERRGQGGSAIPAPQLEHLSGDQTDDQHATFMLLSQATHQVVWDWDVVHDQRWLGENLQRVIGVSLSGGASAFSEWSERIHPHDRAGTTAALRSALDCRETSWSAQYRLRRDDGRYAWVWDRATIIYSQTGKPVRMVGAMADLTLQREAEMGLRRLTGRMLEAQEAERNRVARELHDGVSQYLSAAKFRLQLVKKQPGALEEPSAHLAKAHDLVAKAIDEVRRISRNLRPSELDDLGLEAAVRTTCDEVVQRTGLQVLIETADFPKVLAPEIELALYRIIQESLRNVEKHAQATQVSVVLARRGPMLVLALRDNGRGFRKDASAQSGLGLAHIRERAAFVDGTAEISSTLGQGTEVLVQIPLVRGLKPGSEL